MKRTLAIVWLGSIGLAIGLSGYLKAESTHFFGIADQTEQTISFAHPVEVVAILAGESAQVGQGEPILRLRRPDLSSKLAQIDDQIRIAKSRHQENTSTLQAELKAKQAERITTLGALDQKIAALKSRLDLNLKLVQDISGGNGGNASNSPLATELKGLRSQRRHIDRSLMAHVQGLQEQLNQDLRPHEARIADLNNRKAELQSQLTDLTVLAQFAGRVGTIKAKPGEHVAPYKPILTIHGQAPRFIKGYINENVHNAVDVGQAVWVYSQRKNQKPEAIEAVVESLGTRIVEYPMRLKRHPSVQAFGREAIVKLPPDAPLLLGEKVLVSMHVPEQPLDVLARVSDFFADSIGTAQAAMHAQESSIQTKPVRSSIADLNVRKLEPSGIVLNPGSGEFLVVSDETGSGPAFILGMDINGQINSKRSILGASGIDDMESIRRVGKDYFVLASLSHNRKGERKDERCQMLRLQENATHFQVIGQLNLCQVIEEMAQQTNDAEAREFLKLATSNLQMDIEAHDFSQNNLYLGFKSPWDGQGQTVIMQLPDFSAMLEGNRQARIWHRVLLPQDKNAVAPRLADMVIHQGTVYLLGVRVESATRNSELWAFDPESGLLKSLALVPKHAFEGLSDAPLNQQFTLISDGGGKRLPHYLTIRL